MILGMVRSVFHQEDLAVMSIPASTHVVWKVVKQNYRNTRKNRTLVLGGLTNKVDQKKVMI